MPEYSIVRSLWIWGNVLMSLRKDTVLEIFLLMIFSIKNQKDSSFLISFLHSGWWIIWRESFKYKHALINFGFVNVLTSLGFIRKNKTKLKSSKKCLWCCRKICWKVSSWSGRYKMKRQICSIQFDAGLFFFSNKPPCKFTIFHFMNAGRTSSFF